MNGRIGVTARPLTRRAVPAALVRSEMSVAILPGTGLCAGNAQSGSKALSKYKMPKLVAVLKLAASELLSVDWKTQ